MRWSDVIDAANPANVPRIVFYREQSFMPLEPCSDSQQAYLMALLRETRSDPAEFFGDGFAGIEALSSWSASWAIAELRDLRHHQEHADAEAKRLMGAIMRERMEQLPVRRCEACGEDRPHRVVSAVLICMACKAVSE
jgi:hypothetical protein